MFKSGIYFDLKIRNQSTGYRFVEKFKIKNNDDFV